MLIPYKIGPFCTGLRYVPDNLSAEVHPPDPIVLGGCLTNADEDLFYSKEELQLRMQNRDKGE